jgi:hypothetical protein
LVGTWTSTISSRSTDADDGHHFKTNTETKRAKNNPVSTKKS